MGRKWGEREGGYEKLYHLCLAPEYKFLAHKFTSLLPLTDIANQSGHISQ